MEEFCRDFLIRIGEDPKREGLLDTPRRFTQTLIELTKGYSQRVDDIVEGSIFKDEGCGPVTLQGIEFYSLCEHHLLPFFGTVTVSYKPDGKVLGLSKIPQLVNIFSRRLQLQERLTADIASAIEEAVSPKGVGVFVRATHLCMMVRTPQAHKGEVTTKVLRGEYERDPLLRELIFK